MILEAEYYEPSIGPFWPFVRDRVRGAMLDFVRSEWKDEFHVELSPVRISEGSSLLHHGLSNVSRPPVNGRGQELQSACLTPEELAVAEERGRIVRRLMLRLSPRQRVVVDRLAAGEGTQEIARSLGIKTITVNVISHQALKRMRASAC